MVAILANIGNIRKGQRFLRLKNYKWLGMRIKVVFYRSLLLNGKMDKRIRIFSVIDNKFPGHLTKSFLYCIFVVG